MDSPAIGLRPACARGLPPTTYGAGKNLFSNPFISFFMRNLGAYRVDRRLRFELYKDVLKEYSTVLLEHGYHSLFFPGGTRCRVEHRREAPQARPARHDGHRVQEHRARGRAEQAALHRAGDDQLPARARGRDADRRLPRRDRQEPLHHHRRRILARRPHRRVLPQDPRARGLGRSCGSAGRSIRSATTSPTTASRSIAPAASSIRRATCAAPTARSPTTISATPSTRARSAAGSPRCIRG